MTFVFMFAIEQEAEVCTLNNYRVFEDVPDQERIH